MSDLDLVLYVTDESLDISTSELILNLGIMVPVGGGNVSGPASATDNHLAVFDGTTGKLIKDGGAIPSAPPIVGPTANGLAPQTDSQQFEVLMQPSTDGHAAWARVTQDMILAAFSISMSPVVSTNLEVSQSLPTPSFTASYNRTAAAAVLTDDQGSSPKNVISTPTSFASNGTFQKNSYGGSASFTLTANESGGPSKTSSVTFNWLQKVYYGTAVPGTINQAFVTALASNAIASSRSRTFTVSPGATEKVYYAFRSAYGTPTFTVGGFAGGFSLVATISITNAFGFSENFDVWASNNVGLAAGTQVVVS